MDHESLYRQLGQLLSTPPEFGRHGQLDVDTQRWLGRVGALLEQGATTDDVRDFRFAADHLVGVSREQHAHAVVSILSRAVARLETLVPTAVQGAYIPVGAQFDVFQMVGKLFARAKADILIVDPYVDQTMMTEYAALAPAGVTLRLLGDERYKECGTRLTASLRAWDRQHGAARPASARIAPAKALHDRLVILDGAEVYNVGQSFKDIAKTSPTSFTREPPEVAAEKVSYHDDLWAAAPELK